MEIRTVSIIGLGALGVMFGHHLSRHLPSSDLRIIADPDRIYRYKRDGVFCNGERCDFNYIEPEQKSEPADLLIFAVKFNGLNSAIKAVENQVGSNTIILSLINGISSEDIISKAYGTDKVLYSVAQGMDALKVDNNLTYHQMGIICFGDKEPAAWPSEKTERVRRFFERVELPHQVDTDMQKRLWGKLMFNVGLNQVTAVYECDYGGVQKEGSARDTMISAMEEVIVLAEKENVHLTQADLSYWLSILDGLTPLSKPSMRQDLEAKRQSEVELFAGTVLALAKKHSISCPINQMLYDRIKEIENSF